MDQRLTQIEQIEQNGSPAQADLARELLAQGPSPEAELLYDAYLHDPYLTR